MAPAPVRSLHSRAFTLIELIAVIVVLAILAGVAIPKYFDYAQNAKASSVKGTLGGTRSAIANFYGNSAVNGTAAYPTLTEMQTVGTVLQEPISPNPYNNDATIAAATYVAASPPVAGTSGWNYDATSGKFWCNSATASANTW
jgi:prepilin-type N-terminal cleavage/methylation domain-containing protein